MASVNQPLYDLYPLLSPAQIDAMAAGSDGEGVALRFLYPMLDAANAQAQEAANVAKQSTPFQQGVANGSIVKTMDETGGVFYYQKNPDGTITNYSPTGAVTGTYDPSKAGKGFFGDILGGLGSAVNSITSDPILSLAAAAMTGGALSNAGLLGTGAASGAAAAAAPEVGAAAGGLGSMASTVPTAAQWAAMESAGANGLLSSGAASALGAGAATAAVAPEIASAIPSASGLIESGPFAGSSVADMLAANSGSSTIASGLGSMASTVPTAAQWTSIGNAIDAGLLPASAAIPSVTNGLLSNAATGAASTAPEVASAAASSVPVNTTTLAGVDAASTAAGAASGAAYPGLSAGAGIGAAGGAMATSITGNSIIDGLLNKVIDNPIPIIGAALGAAGSGSSTTSTTADKSPWAPAQDWMKANIARGQQLQKQYQDNPFSAFQQQAYNNQAGLGNQFRGMVNGMVPQMNAFRPYQRTPQSQVVSPYNFGTSNLGMTKSPFGG